MDSIDEKLYNCLTIPGMSGHEGPIRKFIQEELSNYGEIYFDNLGSVICKISGTRPTRIKWYISAHLDTCGFIVHSIHKTGYINCISFGYNNHEVCNDQPVKIITSNGSVNGIMRTSLDRNKRKIFQIDINAKKPEIVKKFGILGGDPVHFANEPYWIGSSEDEVICSPRLDNRLGLYELILLAQTFQHRPPEDDIFLVGTVEEEVGGRGAQTSATMIQPDIALILDATYEEGPVSINNGPVITLSDAAGILPIKIRDYLLDLAKRNTIPIQTEVWNIGQTDAGRVRIANTGIPTIPILTATKNNHSPKEIGSIKDCRAVVQYIELLVSTGSALLNLFHP